ncbi:MAG TPA: chemotaxis protein CheW [Methylomirabilota bacterium]|jgi:chemotaxis signal transduction protein
MSPPAVADSTRSPALISGAADRQAQSIRACMFTLAGKPFAVDVRYAREVVDFATWTAVPRAPGHILGVANLRGVIVPIVDIQPLLGLGSRTGRGLVRALVMEEGGFQVGIAIDDVVGLEPFEAVVPLSDRSRREYGEFATGLLARGDGFVTLLDSPGILHSARMRPWAHKDG